MCLRIIHGLSQISFQQSRIQLAVDDIFSVSGQNQASQLKIIGQMNEQLRTHSRLFGQILDSHRRSGDLSHSVPIRNPQQSLHTTSVSSNSDEISSSSSVLGIRASGSANQRYPCHPSCNCKCHGFRPFRSPHFLSNFLGSLFIGYCGNPTGSHRKCSSRSCLSQLDLTIRVTYFFPRWFWAKILDMTITTASFSEPHMSITVRGVVLPNGIVYNSILVDDDHTMRHLLATRFTRPNDLLGNNGYTLLAVSYIPVSLAFCATPFYFVRCI